MRRLHQLKVVCHTSAVLSDNIKSNISLVQTFDEAIALNMEKASGNLIMLVACGLCFAGAEPRILASWNFASLVSGSDRHLAGAWATDNSDGPIIA